MKAQAQEIIDCHERRRLVPYSDTHIRRLERAGLFPHRVRLGPNRVGWLRSEVLNWIKQRMINRPADKFANSSTFPTKESG